MEESEISRKIFWWTLFVLFWITSAIIIGYAFGYRFNLKKGIFVYAGSITLKTTPQESDVYINNKLYSAKKLNRINNSYHIGGIFPGEYLLEVKSSDHNSWSKKITVQSGISTEFWNIVLTNENPTILSYTINGILKFFISPRKNNVAVAQKENDIFSVSIFSPDKTDIKNIFSSNEYSFTDNEKENIEWTPQAHRIIIPTIKNDTNEKTYFIASTDDEEKINLKDITNNENISNVRWDPETKNVLFYMLNNDLFRIDLDNPTESKMIAQNISSYELASNGLYFFQLPEGIVYKTNFSGTNSPKQITRISPDMTNDQYYKIIAYDDQRMTLINNSGSLYIFNQGENEEYFKKISSNSKGSQFSDDGKKLLFWNDNEIFVYFVREWDVQPAREESELIPITRYAEKIKNIQWSRDYEHIIFTVDKKIKLIELDQRDRRNLMDITSLNIDDSYVVNNNSDALIYFTNKDENGYLKLYSLEFPERTKLLENIITEN